MLNRRLFVAATASAAGMLTAAKSMAFTVMTPSMVTSADTPHNQAQPWGQQHFRQLQGDRVFLQDAAGKRFEAQLSAVTDMGSNAEVEQFAVDFSTAQPLPEGLYRLSHRTAGRCQLYLSAADQSCCALFSLLR
ncbi:MAG: hypothetical protein R3F53_28905 [Gammaproteobacteria bacterium]